MMEQQGTLAIHISGWDRYYEVTNKGRPWQLAIDRWREQVEKAEEKGEELPEKPVKRKKELDYIRSRVYGLDHGEEYQDLIRIAGPNRAGRTFGLFQKMLEIAGKKIDDYRGWILDGKLQAMGPADIGRKLGWSAAGVAEDVEILIRVGWIEILTCPFAVICGKPVMFSHLPNFPEKLERSHTLETLSRIPLLTEFTTEKSNLKLKTETERHADASASAGSPAGEGHGERGEKENGDGGTGAAEGLDSVGSPAPARSDSEFGGSGDRVSVSSEDSVGSGFGAAVDSVGSVAGGSGRGGKTPLESSAREIRRAENSIGGMFDEHFKNEWMIRLQKINIAEVDPKFLLKELPAEPEMRKAALLWVAEQFMIGLFTNELLSRSDQGQADRVTFFGREGYGGFLRAIIESEEDGGIIKALRICQRARKKTHDAAHPLRKPMAWITKQFKQLLGSGVGARPP